MKHKQVLANLIDFKLIKFLEIDLPISDLQGKTISQLIMDLKTKDGETIFVVVERNQQGEQVSWVKRKHKEEAELYSSHMVVQLVKLHGDCITAKLDPDVQQIAKTVAQRDNTSLYLEEAEIEDSSKMKIDQLINIKELETTATNDKSVTIDNASISSFRNKVSFS